MDASFFEEIGLTPSEQKVYLSLLELGDTTRSEIVAHTQVTGSKIYDLLDRLQKKGLVSIYTKNKVKHFKALHPNQILNFLESKQEHIESQKQQAKHILPMLTAQFLSSKQEQEVEVLTGLKSIRTYFDEQINELRENEYNYVIGGTKIEESKATIAFYKKIHAQREVKKIKTKMLYNENLRPVATKAYSKKEYPGTTTKFIDHGSAVAINIFNNKTLITIFGKEITGIKITSQDVANSFLEYFTLLWKQAKS